jgi:hypothetical protein
MYYRPGPPGYYINEYNQLIPEEEVQREYYQYIAQPSFIRDINEHLSNGRQQWETVTFGGGFTAKELASGGLISGLIALMLGAGLPGALVMGMGSMVVEAGSTRIPAGWKRYVLGLFRAPKK